MQILGLPFLRSRQLPRFILWGGGSLILAVIVVFAAATLWLRHQALSDSERQLSQLNVVLAEQVERSFNSVDSVLETIVSLAKRPGFDELATRQRLQLYLNQRMDGFPQARSFLVLDKDGDLVIDSRSPNPRAFNGADREYFGVLKNDRRDRMQIDAPVVGRLANDWLFTVSRRLEDQNGDFAGVVLSAIEISFFTQFFKTVQLGEDGAISLVRRDGTYLMGYPLNENLLGRRINGRIHKEFAPYFLGGVLHDTSPVDATSRLISYRNLYEYEAFVVVSRAKDAILESWGRQAFALGLFALLSMLVLSAFGFVLVRMAKAQDELLLLTQEARAAAEHSARAAEYANQLKTKFFNGISHDLRTPLNAIAGFSDLLLAGHGGALSDKSREYVGDIQGAGRHLLELLNDLLDLAKVEAGRMTLAEDRFALRSLIDDCLRQSAPLAAQAGVTLVPYQENEFGLRADQMRLRQILFNLLSNAIKFTPADGKIEIKALRADDGSLRLSVIDSGIGMDKAGIATALEPYGQVTNDFTRARKGTGLGLPLVKALAELHGGRLEIKSAPNKGSTFTVVLPANRLLALKSARVA